MRRRIRRSLIFLCSTAFLALLFLPPPAGARRVTISITPIASLPSTCIPEGHAYIVTDSNTDGTDCSSGGGSTPTWCFCDSSGTGYNADPNFSPNSDPHVDHTFDDQIFWEDIDYSETLAADPALLVDECFFTSTGTGGCFICEGSVADANEMNFCFQNLNEADTTQILVTENATQTLVSKTINTASNTITIVAADISDQNAGTDITADLEEELQIGVTDVTGNAIDDQFLLGTGANAVSWSTMPNCNVTTEKLDFNGTALVCATDQTSGSAVLVFQWLPWQLNPDGQFCKDTIAETLNGGPVASSIQCDDNAGSIIYAAVGLDDYAGGTIIFKLEAWNTNATPSGILDFDFSAMCRGDSDPINSTWGAVQNASITFDTQNDLEIAATAAVTPDGTCATADTLFLRAVMDDTATTTQVADARILRIRAEEQ